MVNPSANPKESNILNTFFSNKTLPGSTPDKHGRYEWDKIGTDVTTHTKCAWDAAEKCKAEMVKTLIKINPNIEREIVIISSASEEKTPNEKKLHRVAFSNAALKTIREYNEDIEHVASGLNKTVTIPFNKFLSDPSHSDEKDSTIKGIVRRMPDFHLPGKVSMEAVFNKETNDFTLTFTDKNGDKSTKTMDVDNLKSIIGCLSWHYK